MISYVNVLSRGCYVHIDEQADDSTSSYKPLQPSTYFEYCIFQLESFQAWPMGAIVIVVILSIFSPSLMARRFGITLLKHGRWWLRWTFFSLWILGTSFNLICDGIYCTKVFLSAISTDKAFVMYKKCRRHFNRNDFLTWEEARLKFSIVEDYKGFWTNSLAQYKTFKNWLTS